MRALGIKTSAMALESKYIAIVVDIRGAFIKINTTIKVFSLDQMEVIMLEDSSMGINMERELLRGRIVLIWGNESLTKQMGLVD